MKSNDQTSPRIPHLVSRAGAVAAAAAMLIPGAAGAAPTQARKSAPSRAHLSSYEKRYLEVRQGFVEANGVRAAGRNIVRHGYLEHDGDVHAATRSEVESSIATMKPPAVVETAVSEPSAATPATTETSSSTEGAAAASSTAQCESGGDYGAVNPAGYYGAYQFDQGTWDAYAPEGYSGVNPASAPPEVQDAAAAAVPYDAWPNCP